MNYFNSFPAHTSLGSEEKSCSFSLSKIVKSDAAEQERIKVNYPTLNLYSSFPGETLLSPLVMCGPHGTRFLKPVELRLPHSASMTPEGWSFALKSSDTASGNYYIMCRVASNDRTVRFL